MGGTPGFWMNQRPSPSFIFVACIIASSRSVLIAQIVGMGRLSKTVEFAMIAGMGRSRQTVRFVVVVSMER